MVLWSLFSINNYKTMTFLADFIYPSTLTAALAPMNSWPPI